MFLGVDSCCVEAFWRSWRHLWEAGSSWLMLTVGVWTWCWFTVKLSLALWKHAEATTPTDSYSCLIWEGIAFWHFTKRKTKNIVAHTACHSPHQNTMPCASQHITMQLNIALDGKFARGSEQLYPISILQWKTHSTTCVIYTAFAVHLTSCKSATPMSRKHKQLVRFYAFIHCGLLGFAGSLVRLT